MDEQNNNQEQKENSIAIEQPLTKRERRELKKQEKQETLRAERKKRTLFKIIKFSVILAIVVGALALIVRSVSKEAENLPGQFFPEQGRQHINPGDAHEPYSSNPPTSGPHWANPAQAGIYDKELPDEQLIHNLEHSHVWISYRPDLDSTAVEKLATIAQDYGSKLIITPRSKTETPIALAAWRYLLTLDQFDEAAIRRFIDAHRGKAGPEDIPNHLPSEKVEDLRNK
jgi:hypothetical protein